MQTFTLEEAAALVANKYGWHENAQKTLLKQLLDAAKDGTLIVRHPHTDLPYRPKQYREFNETVGMADLNRFFEAAGAPWRVDNGGETADSLFETEWWNLIQVLTWVYLGDRALVREGAVVREGAAVTPTLLIIAAVSKQGACYSSLDLAETAVIKALQTRGLTAYGLENNAGDLKEIPQLQWADLKFWWDPDHAGPRERFRPGASRWYGLRFKRKDILALWPDRLESLAMADRTPVGQAKEFKDRNGNKPAGGRRDNLRLAMVDGYPKCKAAIKRKPKAEEFYDWLAENDRSGNVEKGVGTGGLRWLDTLGKWHEISVEDFRKRISKLRKSGSIKD